MYRLFLGKLSKQNSENTEEYQSVDTKPSKNVMYNQSLKQRINSLVLKTLQENTGRERQTLLNQNQNYSESWKVRLFQNTRVICSVRECQMVIDDIISKRNAQGNPRNVENSIWNGSGENCEDAWPFKEDRVVIGFDCEGINLGLKGQLTLMQIATMSGFSYIFDLISCPAMIESGLRKLLESKDVIKVSVMFIFT